ncbi:hypothetical protein LWI29_026917 [Acer saccharum]|uniref:Uncharacterized protein n=1 Tax=Acer saccharum TaxID=4024 RepID=A0AA39T0F8_ACESA|nr:hypothetical protein LWI29_026917 [Acer saccharum]
MSFDLKRTRTSFEEEDVKTNFYLKRTGTSFEEEEKKKKKNLGLEIGILKRRDEMFSVSNLRREEECYTDLALEEYLLALIWYEETVEDKIIQIDISDEDLDSVLDRCDLICGSLGYEEKPESAAFLLKEHGWEVVTPTTSEDMLSSFYPQ